MQSVDLNTLRQERIKCLEWKNIKPLWEAIEALPNPKGTKIEVGDTIKISPQNLSAKEEEFIYETAKRLQPWRKGPFLNGGYTIFGEVISGKEVVRKIENTQTGRADRPLTNQVILKAIVKE